jgi:hypothetical protein
VRKDRVIYLSFIVSSRPVSFSAENFSLLPVAGRDMMADEPRKRWVQVRRNHSP